MCALRNKTKVFFTCLSMTTVNVKVFDLLEKFSNKQIKALKVLYWNSFMIEPLHPPKDFTGIKLVKTDTTYSMKAL